LFLTLVISVNGQSDVAYKIIVAGHAYGAHAGTNIGLHPPFLEKLNELRDSSIAKVFLTGDIVNQSTVESWNKVETELSTLDLDAFYVMGNHDNNTIGKAVFQKKHGGEYYSFSFRNELYVVLNSTESDRSISAIQLQFLDKVLKNAESNQSRVFIFFHEVIWNSNEKYRLVRSNSRSRYNLISGISNFWNEVFPMFTNYPERKFYLFAGDVGGNPDAIAASYDRWGNVTLLSSGMGEVKDENYLQVQILPDTVTYTLVPLHNDIEMHPITWYNVPELRDSIEGPVKVFPEETDVRYQIVPAPNATSYRWNVSAGMQGSSDSSAIVVSFDSHFQIGEISVTAINDGFGESEPEVLQVKSGIPTSIVNNVLQSELILRQNQQFLQIGYNSIQCEFAKLSVYDQMGRLLVTESIKLNTGLNFTNVDNSKLIKGVAIVALTFGNNRIVDKVIVF